MDVFTFIVVVGATLAVVILILLHPRWLTRFVNRWFYGDRSAYEYVDSENDDSDDEAIAAWLDEQYGTGDDDDRRDDGGGGRGGYEHRRAFMRRRRTLRQGDARPGRPLRVMRNLRPAPGPGPALVPAAPPTPAPPPAAADTGSGLVL